MKSLIAIDDALTTKKILVIDDDESIRLLFHKAIEKEGVKCFTAPSFEESLELLNRYHFDVILLDQNLGTSKGTEVLPSILEISPLTKIVFLTSTESISLATRVMTLGASDFLLKKDPLQENLKKLFNLLEVNSNKNEDMGNEFSGIVAVSSAMRSILSQIYRLRNSSTTVLLTGESGVGKEMIAQAIHKISSRVSEPFLAVNCAAIAENLLESELFGAKKGAYTDLKSDRKGYFLACSEGTLLLDEIGEMNLSLQAKLLRVLQEKEVTPLGDFRPIKINTRIIAATNRDFKSEIAKGRFREDLFYRLAVITIRIPALRERTDDIEPLVRKFLQTLNLQHQKEIRPPGAELLARLKAYSWPGNIRELYNAVERAVLLSRDQEMKIEDMLPHREIMGDLSEGSSLEMEMPIDYSDAKDFFEKIYLEKLLETVKGNISDAAKISGQYRTNIYRLLKKHNIKASRV